MIDISSEIGKLGTVLVHRPGDEHACVPPSELDHYLLEDILFAPQARRESEIYHALIASSGATVHRFTDLLRSALSRSDVRRRCLRRFTTKKSVSKLTDADPDKLVDFLMGRGDFEDQRLHALPNLLFQRDIGTVVNNTLVRCRMKEKVRVREQELLGMVLEHHTDFQDTKSIEPRMTLEGGDVCVLRRGLVVIGYGHRTSMASVLRASQKFFNAGIETIVMVSQPDSRQHMHLDTVFTQIDRNECLMYAPAFNGSERLKLSTPGIAVLHKMNSKKTCVEYFEMTFLDCLSEFGIDLSPVYVGGGNGDHVGADQEQWWDGANSLAIAPGKIVLYERNLRTIQALADAGLAGTPFLRQTLYVSINTV